MYYVTKLVVRENDTTSRTLSVKGTRADTREESREKAIALFKIFLGVEDSSTFEKYLVTKKRKPE